MGLPFDEKANVEMDVCGVLQVERSKMRAQVGVVKLLHLFCSGWQGSAALLVNSVSGRKHVALILLINSPSGGGNIALGISRVIQAITESYEPPSIPGLLGRFHRETSFQQRSPKGNLGQRTLFRLLQIDMEVEIGPLPGGLP